MEYRYKYIGLKTEGREVQAHFKKYTLPAFLSIKSDLFLSEKETWKLDRDFYRYIIKKQDEGMSAFSPRSISLMKTHDNLHKGFLEIQSYKSANDIALDVEVKFM